MARKPKHDERTKRQRQKEFLQAYADTFDIKRAAALAGLQRSFHYRWMRADKAYAAAFQSRKDEAFHFLEAEAIDRAGNGWMEDVYYQGDVCGQVRRFDSGLMQFLLRGMAPEKYGAKTEISGPQGTPVQAKIEVVFVNPPEQ